jgi:hypothetical protein
MNPNKENRRETGHGKNNVLVVDNVTECDSFFEELVNVRKII